MPLAASDDALAPLLDLARDLAERAGAIQRERYETELTVDTKSASIDLVTEVDRACEKLIVDGIQNARPDDAILAEEGHGEDRDAPFRWIIDPLDGTTNFAHGFPRFCVSIGIERRTESAERRTESAERRTESAERRTESAERRTESAERRTESADFERAIGVVYDPLLDERFEAVKGEGAWLCDRRLAVSREDEWGRALVATGFAYDVHRSDDDNLESFRNVVKSARGIRRDGSAALDLCYVAAGRIDAYWELKLHPWDVAAGYLILEEAGGRVTDFVGGPPDRRGREVASSNGRLHEALLERIVRPS